MATATLPRHRVVQRRTLASGWPLYAMFAAFPVWWLLGLGSIVWPFLAVPMLFALLAMPRVRAPRGFGLWLLFLLWMAASATQLQRITAGYIFTYRFGLYVTAAVVFLYVYNMPRERLPSRKVVAAVLVFFALVVVGGYLGMLFPSASFTTVTEKAMPSSVIGNGWVRELVHVRFAQVQSLTATIRVTRPSAPFPFSNEWGANFALLVPFAILAAGRLRGALAGWTRLLLVASIVPLVLTGNRGAWLALAIAIPYAALRLAWRGNLRAFIAVFAALVAIAIAIVATPLGTALQERASHTQSNQTRYNLYAQTIEGVRESPLLGYGSPQPQTDPKKPPVGTHGQLWMIMYSHGIPAAILFVGWLVLTLWRTRRARSPVAFWCNVVIFTTLVMLPFYDLLTSQIYVVMVAAGLAWREVDMPVEEPAAAARPAMVGAG